MLVPTNRLILWTGLVGVPFAIVAGTVPGSALVCIAALAALLVVAIVDAVLAPGRLQGIRISAPELVRLHKDREGTIELEIHNESNTARLLRIGLALPPEIQTASADRWVHVPAGSLLSRLNWCCRPKERGSFSLREVYLELRSPLGFWSVRRQQPIASELRVYPNLAEERRQVSALFLRRNQVGPHILRGTGHGREFEKLRDYLPGDSIGDIHWKASAKRGRPVSKSYQVERTHEVYVIIDASRLSARPVTMPKLEELSGLDELSASDSNTSDLPASRPALERYVTAALLVGTAAEQQGDEFGVVTFSDRVHTFLRARNGQAHYDTVRDHLYGLQPQLVSPDYEELCSFLRLRLRKRALLIFLTALDDPLLAETFVKSTDLISRQHLLLVNMLQPHGARPLFSDPTEVQQTSDLYERLGGHLRWQSLRELQMTLQRRGVRFSLIDPEKLSAELIAQQADIRARQLV